MTQQNGNVRSVRGRRASISSALFEAMEGRLLMSGNPHKVLGASAVEALVVGTQTSTLTVTVTPDTIVGDSGTLFTGTFSNLPVGQVPVGSVTFFEVAAAGSTTPILGTVGTGTINAAGVATFNAPGPFTVGPHYFFAQFTGDATFAAVDSATTTLTVNPKIASTVTLVLNDADPTYGETVPFTASVSLADLTPPATGSITLKNLDTGDVYTATATNPDGSATFNVPLSALMTNFAAIYAGDATHAAGQSGTLLVTAAKAPTTLSATPGPYGRVVTVDVGLPAGFPDSLKSTFGGTVSLYEGSTLLGTVILSAGNTSARFVLATIPVGVHNLHATFGTSDFFADSATDVKVTTVKIPTAAKLTLTNDGDALTIGLGMPGDVPPELLPLLGGTISLYDGKKLVATIPASDPATVDISGWRNGLHRIKAVYSGDPIFKCSVSTSFNWIRTPHGPKVPPGFEHAKGLNNLGSGITAPDDSEPAPTPVITVVSVPAKKGKGHNK